MDALTSKNVRWEIFGTLYDAAVRGNFTNKTIEIAFVSFPAAESDLDLVVIGDIGMRRLSTLLSGCEKRIGRTINPHTYSAKEFKKRVVRRDHFVTQLLSSPKVFIIGSEKSLREMAERLK